jgi:hypothetical protein
MGVLPGIGGLLGGFREPVTGAFLSRAVSDSDTSTYNFFGVPFGEARDNRHILVLTQGTSTSSNAAITTTVGGVVATQLCWAAPGTTASVGAYLATVPAGASGTIQVKFSGIKSRCFYSAWAIYGLEWGAGAKGAAVNTAVSGSSPPTSPTIDSADGNFVAAAIGITTSGSSGDFAWNNMTSVGQNNINGVLMESAYTDGAGDDIFTPSIAWRSGLSGLPRWTMAVSF